MESESDYVFVSKDEALAAATDQQDAGAVLKQRKPAERDAPDSPGTCAPSTPLLRPKAASRTPSPESAETVLSALLISLLTAISAVKVLVQHIRAAAPQLLGCLRATTHQAAQLGCLHDFASLRQRASLQLASLASTAAAAAQRAMDAVRQTGASTAAGLAFFVHHPAEGWKHAQAASWSLYLRTDPNRRLASATAALARSAAALYARMDPSGRVPAAAATAWHSHAAPALSKAAAKVQPWAAMAWDRTAPVLQGLWGDAKAAWAGPGMTWVLILGGGVAAIGCAVAVLGGL